MQQKLLDEVTIISQSETNSFKKHGLPIIQLKEDYVPPDIANRVERFRTFSWLWEAHVCIYWLLRDEKPFGVDYDAEDEAIRFVSLIYKNDTARKMCLSVILLLGFKYLDDNPWPILEILADTPMA